MNTAGAYDVTITPAIVDPGQAYWRAVQVRHLTPAENRGRHHVFVDIVDAAGRPVRNELLRIGWTWRGRRPDEPAPPQPLDKPLDEPAGNVDLASTNQVTTVWIADPVRPSDAVEGLHTKWPDELGPGGETWNSMGHHSFYVQFQLTAADGSDPGGGGGDSGGDLSAAVADLQRRVARIERVFDSWDGEL